MVRMLLDLPQSFAGNIVTRLRHVIFKLLNMTMYFLEDSTHLAFKQRVTVGPRNHIPAHADNADQYGRDQTIY
jgi:hypothetical protein